MCLFYSTCNPTDFWKNSLKQHKGIVFCVKNRVGVLLIYDFRFTKYGIFRGGDCFPDDGLNAGEAA